MKTDAYRDALLAKREEVLASLGEVKFDALARMGRMAEEDQAQATHDEFISLRRNRIEYGQLRLIEAALDRLETGDFGACQGCESAIPAKRLAAIPWARYCVSCQEAAAQAADGDEHDERVFHPALVGY
jgi:DnaK suppressor protein